MRDVLEIVCSIAWFTFGIIMGYVITRDVFERKGK